KNDVVFRINILFQAEFLSAWIECMLRKVEVAAAGDFVSKNIATSEVQLGKSAVLQTLIKNVIRVPLDGQFFILQKGEVLDLFRVVEINQNRHALRWFRNENGSEQAGEAEWREV